MSTKLDTPFLFGVTRPAPDSCDERGKQVKSKPKPKYEWESKPVKDLKMSDFSMYDDDIEPFTFVCAQFTYKNKAQIQKDKEIEVAMAEYYEQSRNLSVFDAIRVPKIAGKCGSVGPLPMTDDLRLELTPLCKLALDKYNDENQGANFVFTDVVKTTYRAGGMYYITFQAQLEEIPLPSSPAITTFQAQVFNWRTNPPSVMSCAIKTT